MTIGENLEKVRSSIDNTCTHCGRNTDSVTLVAVSKFHPVESIESLISEGHSVFGENRVQEACSKFNDLKIKYPSLAVHLIGSLQRNKVKQIVSLASCIESVDRIELLHEISKSCVFFNTTIDILFEYHTGEQTKQGFMSEYDLYTALDSLNSFPLLTCKGLMTMAPFTNDEKLLRSSFQKLRSIQKSCSTRYPNLDFSVLSMGMSNDYTIAIEEGSTEVRIGTAIFGEAK